MNETVKAGQIPAGIQQAIVGAALGAAINALSDGLSAVIASEHARTADEAGVRAWQ
ncbi:MULTISPECIES: hypothetical protein [Bordetella]|uniref:hypothetical protein n=1 Tax=Bordetella TaxID=517 RepID=UPI0014821C96|nr:hypothetical protein [Bordetella genomosp. 2]